MPRFPWALSRFPWCQQPWALQLGEAGFQRLVSDSGGTCRVMYFWGLSSPCSLWPTGLSSPSIFLRAIQPMQLVTNRTIQPINISEGYPAHAACDQQDYPAHLAPNPKIVFSQPPCSPKNPGQTIQSTVPKKLQGLSSPHFRGGTIQSTVPKKTLHKLSSPHFPKKPCRDYPVHTTQKNPGGTIQSTVPKKTLEGLSSPRFPKKPCKDYPVHTSQKKPAGTIQSTLPKKKPAGTIQSTVPKKMLEGLSSPQFPKKNPDAFSPSAGLRFAKPSLHRSVPGIPPAVLVPAVFFLASQPGSLKKRLSSQKLGRLSKAKSQSLPIWLSAHTFSKSPYCYRTSASCSLALSHLSASCCGPQSWSSGIFCRDQSQFWGAALQTSHPLDVRLQKKKVCFQAFPAHFDSKNMPTLRLGLSSPFGLKNQP